MSSNPREYTDCGSGYHYTADRGYIWLQANVRVWAWAAA